MCVHHHMVNFVAGTNNRCCISTISDPLFLCVVVVVYPSFQRFQESLFFATSSQVTEIVSPAPVCWKFFPGVNHFVPQGCLWFQACHLPKAPLRAMVWGPLPTPLYFRLKIFCKWENSNSKLVLCSSKPTIVSQTLEILIRNWEGHCSDRYYHAPIQQCDLKHCKF